MATGSAWKEDTGLRVTIPPMQCDSHTPNPMGQSLPPGASAEANCLHLDPRGREAGAVFRPDNTE